MNPAIPTDLDKDGTLLYVGISLSAVARATRHRERDGHVIALAAPAYAPRIAELLDRHGLVDVPDTTNTWPPPVGAATARTPTTESSNTHGL